MGMTRKNSIKYRYVTNEGKLIDSCLPAIYFDSSVVIDYWMTEGFEIDPPDDIITRTMKANEPKENEVMRGLFKSDKRFNKVVEIRKKLLFDEPKFAVVMSPLCLLELIEWNAEAAFKEISSRAAGTMAIQRKGKKEIGDYLNRLLALRAAEVKRLKGKRREFSTGLEIIMGETWINSSFAECHGLKGLIQADIVNFKFTVSEAWQEPSAYAYLQLGVADIMHILIAKHLGCSYIASFDDDFKRARHIIKDATKMNVLSSPEEVLSTLG
jgi:hypothetical protein